MTNEDAKEDDSEKRRSLNSKITEADGSTAQSARGAGSDGKQTGDAEPDSTLGTVDFFQDELCGNDRTIADSSHAEATSARSNEELIRLLALEPTHRKGSLGRIEDYEVLNVVGRGGMGIVARAFDEVLHRNVALKVMSDRLISSDRARKRFFREARAAASINHPNVVTIHAVKERNGVPYLVMEFVEGITLDERIRSSSPCSFEEVLRIGAQIADGLSAAHRRGIIHRDVKPGNVMLENGVERVKLTDFGLARLVVENSNLTSFDNMIGTPAYMSPEQVDGLEPTPASDLFSLGSVLYAMFAGRSPFQGLTSLVCAQRVKNLKPDPISKFAPEIPAEFQKLLNKLLEKDPKERPQNAHEIAEILLDWSASTHQSNPRLLRKISQVHRKRFPKLRKQTGLTICGAICVLSVAAYWFPNTLSKSVLPLIFGPNPLDDNVLVVDSLEGEFKTLNAALEAARPNVQIVLSAGNYQGPFDIADASKFQGVTITGEAGAILSGPNIAPVVRIADVPNVTLTNLSIQSKSRQLGLNFSGSCPGCHVEYVDFGLQHPEQPTVELIRFDFGASGTAAEPILVQNCKFEGGGVGVALGSHDISEQPVCYIHFRNNFVSAASLTYGIPIVFQGPMRHMLVERNTLYRGLGGVSLRFDVPGLAEDVSFRFNTLCDVTNAFFLNDSHVRQGVDVSKNLIVHAEDVSTINGTVERYGEWFKDNQWLSNSPPSSQVVAAMFKLLPESVLKSFDPNSPDFLVPAVEASGYLVGKNAAESEE